MTWTWTSKDWIHSALLSAILLVGIAGLLTMQAKRGPSPSPVPHPAPTPAPPEPLPQPPPPPSPDPAPQPDPAPAPPPEPIPQPEASASPLTKAARDYIRTLPKAFQDLADAVESGQLKTKAEAVAFSKKHAAAMAVAMDQVFGAGVDEKGKITDPGAIAGPLKETARALGAGRVRMSARLAEAH